MRFYATVPFGEEWVCVNGNCYWDIQGKGVNSTANCSPANTYNFVGWPTIYNVVDNVLQKASANSLTVEEFDIENEASFGDYTVLARLVVDNTRANEDVLANLRQRMSNRGFDSSRMTYSATDIRATSAMYDCTSAYGDSARVLHVSETAAAIWGGKIGAPVNPSYINGLTCGGTTGNWWQMPRQHTTATIIDVHSAPCVGISNGNRECDPNQVGSTTNEAITAFNAIAAFLASFAPPNGWRYVCCGYDANMANALVMLGETHGHTLPRSSRDPNTWCPSSDYSMRWDPLFTDYTVTGFNSSNLHGRTLPNGLPGWVAFRPWEYLEYTGPSAALCNPVYVNPPYKASN